MIPRVLAQVMNDPPASWANYFAIMIVGFFMLFSISVLIFLAKHFNPWIQAKFLEANDRANASESSFDETLT